MSEELSEFYIEKAKNELGETESRKEQSIRQFKEWLSKHPFIKYPEIDDKMIIKFLRARKYSMPKVFESFEESLNFARSIKPLTNFTLAEEARMFEIYKAGAFCVMKNRDSNGARVYIIRCKILEDLQVTDDDFLKVNAIVALSLENEVENQIAGIRAISDCRGITRNFYNLLPFKLFFEWIGINRHLPIKCKESFIIGLPFFAVAFFNTAKALLKKKHQERIHTCSDHTELLEYFEPNCLLEEFGGNLKIDECLDAFHDSFIYGFNYLKEINKKFEFDHEKFRELRNGKNESLEENVGSFRKLEID